jgi:chromosome partitioning protein
MLTDLHMKILTVASYKGGVGKSTTAIHLATFFSDKFKVLLIDGDVNRSCLEWRERGKLPFSVADERKAVRLIAEHELIIIDTAARPGTEDLKELAEQADLLVLPTIPDILSLNPMLQTAEALKGIREDAQYRALITANPPSPNTDGKILHSDLQEAGVPVFKTMIRRSLGFGKAALAGVPIRDLKNSQQRLAWTDYENLGKEIEAIWAVNLATQ